MSETSASATSKDQKRAQLGAIYTTRLLATWTAEVLASLLPEKAVVLDPACGDGSLLRPLLARGIKRLVGVDCDADAIRRASRLTRAATFHHADGLLFLGEAARAKRRKFHGAIANPPWGATVHADRPTLASLGYRTLSGQTDSWDLFVDGLLRAVQPGGPIVLILPDAIFLPEHTKIREILANESRIRMIARLGEGFFPGVYRGTVVIAAQNTRPKKGDSVSCVRLTPLDRRAILSGKRSLAGAVEELKHDVPQARFIADSGCRFNIDTREREHALLSSLEETRFPWDDLVEIGRGIELSKTGRIVWCPGCDSARPLPRNPQAICSNCGKLWKVKDSKLDMIVRPNDGRLRSGWHPLIVGEDVDRHACSPSRQIRITVPGIRYKSFETFSRPKLLVRKTGVGLKAAVDESGAATNQVVFHITGRLDAPSFLLDYLEGILCSRVMLAWHLKRQGEIEWRSHPYITPRVIRQFPVPLPVAPDEWTQARAIAAAVRARRSVGAHDSPEDIAVERLVAGMYGLTKRDMEWVLDVLGSVQQLEPIRTLRLESASLIYPLHASRGAA